MTDTSGFLFTELTLTDEKPFVGFAVGEFVDMYGREVEFAKEEINEFLANTLDAIKRAVSKNMPGLPIDSRKHDKGEAAGWITGAELGEIETTTGDTLPVLRFLAKWTELGVELISKKIMTNFSPTVDLARKVVRGGSLTNWAASVDETGTPIFPAIELSQNVMGVMPRDEIISTEVTMTPKEMKAMFQEFTTSTLLPQIGEMVDGKLEAHQAELQAEETNGKTVSLAELVASIDFDADKEDLVASFKKQYELAETQARLVAKREIELAKRETSVAELSQAVTHGTKQVPYGLPVRTADLQEFLLRLEPTDYEFAKSMLLTLQKSGRTEFAQLGHGGQMKQSLPVPAWAETGLKETLAAGNSPQSYFDAAGLGDVSQYDLSQFVEAK